MADATDRAADRTRIVVADDHGVVRAGLRYVLEAEPGFEVVAEARTMPEAARAVRGRRADVLVLDLVMPGGSGIELIAELAGAAPTTAVVVLTMEDDPALARAALRAGARGYVLKDRASADLVAAVHAARAGHTYLTPELGARAALAPDGPPPPPGDLTPREADVLRLIALGHTNVEVGRRLYLSTRTVETHRAHLQQKLGSHTRAELVRHALDHGLIGPEAEGPSASS